MGFAKEIEDFINGYKAISSMATDQQDARTRAQAAKTAADKAAADDMEELATDPEKYLSPSEQARLKRAPKKVSTAVPLVDAPTLIAPYGDNPGEDPEEAGVQMAAGGLVPDKEEDPVEAIPTGPAKPSYDNAAAAKARAAGANSYSGSNGQAMPLRAMNGKARNTYGDETGPVEEEPLPNRSRGPGAKDLFASATKAVQAAMEGFKQDAGRPKQAVGGTDPEIDFSTGKGAATPAEIKAIDAKIDPNGDMEPWNKGRARLAFAYDFFVSRGEPEKAANVAKRILLFDKMASQARGKIAVQLITSGKAADGARVLVDAYNENIHDGSLLDVKPMQDGRFGFTVTKDGKVVQQGAGTAAELAALAGNVANGSEFVRRTARVATPDPDAAAESPAEDASASEEPDAQPASALPVEGTSGVETAAPVDKPTKGKKSRDIAWAKKQYVYAASVAKTWEDAVAKDPSEENKARLKDAQIRLGEAEEDAMQIRLSTVRSKTADKSKIQMDFDEDLAKWREAADPLDTPPAMPTDGLRGAKKAEEAVPASPASPATPAAPVTPKGNPVGYVSGRQGAQGTWLVGGERVGGPDPAGLKAPDPAILSQAKAAIAAGKSRAAVVRKMLENGINPTGL